MTAPGFRVTVVAHRTSGGLAPSASATLTSYEQRNGVWRSSGAQALKGSYFWKVLTGPGSICNLQLATAQGTRPRVVVRLLLTPSIGCGVAQTFVIAKGH